MCDTRTIESTPRPRLVAALTSTVRITPKKRIQMFDICSGASIGWRLNLQDIEVMSATITSHQQMSTWIELQMSDGFCMSLKVSNDPVLSFVVNRCLEQQPAPSVEFTSICILILLQRTWQYRSQWRFQPVARLCPNHVEDAEHWKSHCSWSVASLVSVGKISRSYCHYSPVVHCTQGHSRRFWRRSSRWTWPHSASPQCTKHIVRKCFHWCLQRTDESVAGESQQRPTSVSTMIGVMTSRNWLRRTSHWTSPDRSRWWMCGWHRSARSCSTRCLTVRSGRPHRAEWGSWLSVDHSSTSGFVSTEARQTWPTPAMDDCTPMMRHHHVMCYR